ncbi:cupin domain-containing protein [Rhodanobacter sp. FDAARGOS 1247]|uniref:cupin domain-containing protein n=1 Tax=Rhodanobacter sp. FDAARGOS 1247 TaxID=2778082 RepID=UPI00194E47A1|nr:cupin domain-containing protein [Rhodanobacter sp. FDAARGOS 1247]QRP62849.1 cupin domain-containing protein [Rhodanobacter sp. FDAARGOS 1247]
MNPHFASLTIVGFFTAFGLAPLSRTAPDPSHHAQAALEAPAQPDAEKSDISGTIVALTGGGGAAHNPTPAKPTAVLQRVAIPGTNRQMGMGIAEFPPNASKPLHKASGPEVCYVLEGEVTVQVRGKAAAQYRRGDTFQFPTGVVHVTTAGRRGAKVLAVWAWVPGEPFNTPVAATPAAETNSSAN